MTDATTDRVARGVCAHCGRTYPINRSGRLRGHRRDEITDRRWCAGAWTYPVGHKNVGKM